MKIRLLELLVNETDSPRPVKRTRSAPAPIKSNQAPKKKKDSGKSKSGGGGGGGRARVGAVANRAAEVLVKVSGFSKGGAHAKANLTYIARHGQVELENECGQIIQGKDELRDLARDWNTDIENRARGKQQRDTMHLILSMPGAQQPEAVLNATRRFAAATFGNHEYVMALHQDTANAHCHVTVKCRGFDGTQLHVAKGDPQLWREAFAQELRREGLSAEATPRQARGVTQRAQKQVLRHIDDPEPQGRAPRISRVRRAQFAEAVARVRAEDEGKKPLEQPWQAAKRERQADVRAAWKKAASSLENAPESRDQPQRKTADHERPIYTGTDRRTARVGQLYAARTFGPKPGAGRRAGPARGGPGPRGRTKTARVRQSSPIEPVRRPAAPSVAGVRDVPGRDVVPDHGRTEMLLLADARHDVGSGGRSAPHPGLRRSGAGATANGRGTSRGNAGLSNAELAAQMRAFAASMPPPSDPVQAVAQQLRARRAAQQPAREPGQQPAREPGQQAQKSPRDRGLER